ncbi:peptidoglycan DD-metalloendopeptidase family protein [Vibrio sp. SCSIO 43136]|uniref:peptidoglycan DD-metalloendopeptidase family protein n=1 Tax=Vibrio sp. SCSIO 43136 TaxID=2819101 RepID=UPI0020753B37|nr:peptidoglycan DD-metalloendopeptidase family protein [Vibrio sp. SCSIO 43136]USD65676.1 peptidoglycan DD-metalloendopeptidase family protein [Vibrio sp. SCSIO 43136]
MPRKSYTFFVALGLSGLLVGCAANTPAPVTSLSKSYDNAGKGSYQGSYYEVQKGDTLYFISYLTGKDVKQLISYNRLKAPYTIYPGQKIRLWKPAYVAPSFKDKESEVATNTAKVAASTTAVAAASSSAASPKVETDSSKNSKTPAAQSTSAVAKAQPKNPQKVSKKPLDQSKSKEYVESKSKQVVNNKPQPKPVKNDKINKWIWPTKGRVIKSFSAGDQGNKGIDIAGQRGQSIVSTAKGTVVYSGNALRGYGNLIIIKHNDNYLSAYAHNERLLVKEGQSVKAGQKIATMGSSGANKVQLHFEIRYQGKSVNPNRYLP